MTINEFKRKALKKIDMAINNQHGDRAKKELSELIDNYLIFDGEILKEAQDRLEWIDKGNLLYQTTEQPFIDYFNRLKTIEMSYDEIETKLPQLQNYYFEMVIVKGSYFFNPPMLENLFNDWKQSLIPI